MAGWQRHYGGDWTDYRRQFSLREDDEVDLHFGKRDLDVSYWDAMAEITVMVRTSLQEAQRKGREYVLFRHGYSTSRPGATTARSQVRGFMRSKEATPLIERSKCIQHESIFIAKIRPLA